MTCVWPYGKRLVAHPSLNQNPSPTTLSGSIKLPVYVLAVQTFAIYPQAKTTTPWLLTYAEADNIAYNKDAKKGPVFKPSHDDYRETVDLGAANSKSRTQNQTNIALFWALAGNTSAVSGFWFDIGREVGSRASNVCTAVQLAVTPPVGIAPIATGY